MIDSPKEMPTLNPFLNYKINLRKYAGPGLLSD